MNKRWITGKELMEYMDLTQHELYEFTVLGLPVYDGAGRFIINNMKPKTPGTITRLGAVYVDTGSKMFVDMIGYKKFKIDEVRGFLEERDLMHLVPKPEPAAPTLKTEPTKAPPQEDKQQATPDQGLTIPTPPETTWGQVKFYIPNNDYVQIEYPGGKETVKAVDFGFKGRGADSKSVAWDTFKMIALSGGRDIKRMDVDPDQFKKRIEKIRHNVKAAFKNIDGDPLLYDSKSSTWKTAFLISGNVKNLLGDIYK